MALISCPECKREVSEKALSCPGCGYPLHHPLQQGQSSAEVSAASAASERPDRQPQDVLVTGPSGIPLQQELVGQFCSFIEWILGVNDRDYVREWMMKEWERNDILAFQCAGTGAAILEEFKDAPEETRQYWREIFLFRLEDLGTPLAPLVNLFREICERARLKVPRKGLQLTREIWEAELNQRCFMAGALSGVELEAHLLPDAHKELARENAKKHPDAVVWFYLANLLPRVVWPHTSEADRSLLKQNWGEVAEKLPWLGDLVRFAPLHHQFGSLAEWVDYKRREQELSSQFLQERALQAEQRDRNVVRELQSEQQKRDFGSEVLRWNHELSLNTLKTWSKW